MFAYTGIREVREVNAVDGHAPNEKPSCAIPSRVHFEVVSVMVGRLRKLLSRGIGVLSNIQSNPFRRG